MDVFSRFEKETGGMLMTATLCLLEVSRHGLLETELLALLGSPENLKPPEFVEGEEADVLIKAKEDEKREEEQNVENNNIEHLTEKFKKLVSESYEINKDREKDGNENDNEEEKRAKGRRRIQLLPAREWALIYRNLKQLLRPCGDLGEGRLDFYHRSLSKAVRRK